MPDSGRIEYGDFQTPQELADEITVFVGSRGREYTSMVEPTCGEGSFLVAAINTFGNRPQYYGFDLNEDHLATARTRLEQTEGRTLHLEQQDFYKKDWQLYLDGLPEDILVIGNPPWVTNAVLSGMSSTNLPKKSNFQARTGFSAMTGEANFDISEWMLIQLLEALSDKKATLAMLCKTATARKVLFYCWKRNLRIHNSSIHQIDSKEHFGVSVNACLLLTDTGERDEETSAGTYPALNYESRLQTLGFRNKALIADIPSYNSLRSLDGKEHKKWRSGVKHDASRIMELSIEGDSLINGFGEVCDLEDTYLFPLLKSSDLGNGRLEPRKMVILTQRRIGDDTSAIQKTAPRTWAYLQRHCKALDSRRSSIYRNRPRFSVFGVGEYTFTPWKIAVSGFYKNLTMQLVGPYNGKPVVFDDTCNFMSCSSMEEAQLFYSLLTSDVAKAFLESLVFFDAKRPITIALLKRLDLLALAWELDLQDQVLPYLRDENPANQLQLA